MANTTTTHNGGDAATTSTFNVIAASFDPDTNAYAAMTALKELDSQERIDLRAAAVVVRRDDGQIIVKDETGSDKFVGTAGGGLIGVLVGILGGPLGVLIGGSYGLLVGSMVDAGEAMDSESVLSEISRSVKPGHTVLLAEVDEQSPEVVDAALAQLGGKAVRRSVADVEAEIAAAEKAQFDAQREADRELMRGKRERTKKDAHEKVEQLKAKLPHRQKASSAG
jgi:uncharacterized membrane protein